MKSIAGYLEITQRRVYKTLHRWATGGVRGLEDKPRFPRVPGGRSIFVPSTRCASSRRTRSWVSSASTLPYSSWASSSVRAPAAASSLSIARCMELISPRGRHTPQAMPFEASRRHQYWTVDVSYLDMHQLGGGMTYVISILENFSRAILASAVSRNQELTAYLMVLYAAIRQHGSPEALVSDGGGIFKTKEAMRIYAALGIKKEQIEKKQA